MSRRIKKLIPLFLAIVIMISGTFSVLAMDEFQKELINDFSLEETKLAYTGEELKPNVIVKNAEGHIISVDNYDVAYSNNIKPGKANVKVYMKNDYEGEGSLDFIITPKKASKPKLESIQQKKFTVTVGEDLTASGYQIKYSTSSKFSSSKAVLLGKTTGIRKTITGVKNKTYYVKVRNYKNIDGKRVYGEYSSTAKIKVKSTSPASSIPAEMLESYVLESMKYVGYKVDKHAKQGTLFLDAYSGPRTPMSVRSGIRYGGGPTGMETVKDKSTVSGKAPNLKKFRQQGMCCASFVTYYYLNYLPNIAGVDTSNVRKAVKKMGTNPQSAPTWEAAAKYMVKKGQATVVDKSSRSIWGANLKKLEIGDLLVFSQPNMGVSCGHVAVYAGTYKGDHFVAHVGSDEGPVFKTLERFENVVHQADGCAYKTVYRFKGVAKSRYEYSVKLSKTSYKYNGEAKKPSIKAYDATGKKISSKYYTVHYKNNVKKGTATANVVFKGKYRGSKKLKFKIK